MIFSSCIIPTLVVVACTVCVPEGRLSLLRVLSISLCLTLSDVSVYSFLGKHDSCGSDNFKHLTSSNDGLVEYTGYVSVWQVDISPMSTKEVD